MPLLDCPQCAQQVAVTISQAGSQVTCPGCSHTIPVPKLGDLRKIADAQAELSQASASPQPRRAAAEDQTGRRILFGGLLTIAGIAAIVGAFCLVRYLSITVPGTTEMHIAQVNELFHQSPASQLVREWQEMEKTNLEVALPYNYKRTQVEKARWARNTSIAAGVLAVAGLLALYVGLSDSRRRSAS